MTKKRQQLDQKWNNFKLNLGKSKFRLKVDKNLTKTEQKLNQNWTGTVKELD